MSDRRTGPGESDSLNEDPWLIAQTEEDDNPVLYRLRESVPPGVEPSDYPHLINIFWFFGLESDDGLPLPELQRRMEGLETRLDAIEAPGLGYMVLTITGNGRKEWVWYVCDKDVFVQSINVVMEGMEELPIELESAEDPEWTNFRRLLEAVESSTS